MISLVVFEEITGLTLVMHQDAPSKDVKVGVIDNFCISVASLHVLCAHAASNGSQPLFLELLATGRGKPMLSLGNGLSTVECNTDKKNGHVKHVD